MWDFTEENFKKLVNAQKIGETEWDTDQREYLGACFLGNFKFEIFYNYAGFWYADTLIKATYQDANCPWEDTLEDGTPFSLFTNIDIPLPRRRTIGGFMKAFERRVIEMLANENPKYKKVAELPTLPYHWYEGMLYQPVIVREVIYDG